MLATMPECKLTLDAPVVAAVLEAPAPRCFGIDTASEAFGIICGCMLAVAAATSFAFARLGILGGIEAWGLIGLVLGPALMAGLMLLWREWTGAQEGPLNPAPDV